METILRDALLPRFLDGVHVEWSGWDEVFPPTVDAPEGTTLTDFDAATCTCKSSTEYLESTVEGAANRLAWWEVDKASEPH